MVMPFFAITCSLKIKKYIGCSFENIKVERKNKLEKLLNKLGVPPCIKTMSTISMLSIR